MNSRSRSSTSSRKRKKWGSLLRWPLSQRVPLWLAKSGRNTTGIVTATAPTARPTTGIAMGDGTTEKAINTAVNSAATRETETCKEYKSTSPIQRIRDWPVGQSRRLFWQIIRFYSISANTETIAPLYDLPGELVQILPAKVGIA